MDRKDFIKKSVLGSVAAVAVAKTGLAQKVDDQESAKDLGFNHIPNTKSDIMKNMVLHKANTRGAADHGWLKAKHTFSFANYYNPERVQFGVLRVLNDDIIAGGMGFGTHPHDNMEIITIPIEGELKHRDSMGHEKVIKQGEIQVMSAGTGVQHSEFNNIKDKAINLLQIWLFPNKRGVQPRYDQQMLDVNKMKNTWAQILSPDPIDDGVWIHQNAWFHMGEFSKNSKNLYTIKQKINGLYIFVISGSVQVNGVQLETRDGLGVWDTENFTFEVKSDKTKILLMDVPMR
jgi:redox-sensitive bicupin YhaK (pirin superfamily)